MLRLQSHAALRLQFGLANVYAANKHKIDCSQVMTELQAGKKVAEVAKDMKISRSSVYRCRRAAKKEEKRPQAWRARRRWPARGDGEPGCGARDALRFRVLKRALPSPQARSAMPATVPPDACGAPLLSKEHSVVARIAGG